MTLQQRKDYHKLEDEDRSLLILNCPAMIADKQANH